MVVGFERGYRVSWQTSLGGIPPEMIELNERRWSADHCSVDPSQVPGVFFSSRPIESADAQHHRPRADRATPAWHQPRAEHGRQRPCPSLTARGRTWELARPFTLIAPALGMFTGSVIALGRRPAGAPNALGRRQDRPRDPHGGRPERRLQHPEPGHRPRGGPDQQARPAHSGGPCRAIGGDRDRRVALRRRVRPGGPGGPPVHPPGRDRGRPDGPLLGTPLPAEGGPLPGQFGDRRAPGAPAQGGRAGPACGISGGWSPGTSGRSSGSSSWAPRRPRTSRTCGATRRPGSARFRWSTAPGGAAWIIAPFLVLPFLLIPYGVHRGFLTGNPDVLYALSARARALGRLRRLPHGPPPGRPGPDREPPLLDPHVRDDVRRADRLRAGVRVAGTDVGAEKKEGRATNRAPLFYDFTPALGRGRR